MCVCFRLLVHFTACNKVTQNSVSFFKVHGHDLEGAGNVWSCISHECIKNTGVHQGILKREILELGQLAVRKGRAVKVRTLLLGKELAKKLWQTSSLWELPPLISATCSIK